jgi:hypothetical protein
MDSSLLWDLLWDLIVGVENDINEPTIKNPPQDDLYDENILTLEEQIRLLYPKDITIDKWRSIEEPIRKMEQYYDHREIPSPKKFNRIN